MAGEQKGKAYEALLMVCLHGLKQNRKLKGEVFWNEKPQMMSIEPDFTIGLTSDEPEVVILVTHSSSAKDSEKKFWRNIGELAEAKTRLSTIPHVYTIAFDSVIKADLKKLQEASFDGQLIVGDTQYGKQLLKWVEESYGKLPKGGEAKVEAIAKMMSDQAKGNGIRDLVRNLSDDISLLIRKRRTELDHLWELERKRKQGAGRERKITFMRRGIGKLLILPPPYATALTRDGRLRPDIPDRVVQALEKIGVAKRTISGVRVSDPEMLWVINNLKSDLIEKICQAQPLQQMSEMIEALLSLGEIEAQVEFISQNWSTLTTAAGLFKQLKTCHANPEVIGVKTSTSTSGRVWLYPQYMTKAGKCNVLRS